MPANGARAAVGVPSFRPVANGTYCAIRRPRSPPFSVPAGSGYVVLELVLPLLLLSILYAALGKPLLRLLGAILVLAGETVYRSVLFATDVLGSKLIG